MRFLELRERFMAELAGQPGGIQFVDLNGAPAPDALASAELQWRPAPDRSGALVQDPDWTLPSTAGPVTWRLLYDAQAADQSGPWGYGRR